MRKIITLDSMSHIPQEEAIFVFLSPRGLSKVVSTESIYIRDGNKVLSVGKTRWATKAFGIMNDSLNTESFIPMIFLNRNYFIVVA